MSARRALSFHHHPGNMQLGSAHEGCGDNFVILPAHLRHGLLGHKHWGQSEIELGVHGAAANMHALARSKWMRRRSEDQL